MPKTNKICMYFDKDELESMIGWIDSYFCMNESNERKRCLCENHCYNENDMIIENCECKECKNINEMEEALSRVMKKIGSRLSQ